LWCERISDFLQGGQSFKPEVLQDVYNLLPSFWHGMTPTEKSMAVHVFVEAHASSFTPACVRELHEKLAVPMNEMQSLRVCIDLAISDPSHLERGLPLALACALPDEATSAQAGVDDVADGLISFQLHPTKNGKQILTGLAKFEHLCMMARRSTPARVQLRPSAFIDVEYSKRQEQLLDPLAIDYAMHEIMSHAHGDDAKHRIALRKLDNLGNLRGNCGLANDPVRLTRLNEEPASTINLTR
jgi:hypothetical protein